MAIVIFVLNSLFLVQMVSAEETDLLSKNETDQETNIVRGNNLDEEIAVSVENEVTKEENTAIPGEEFPYEIYRNTRATTIPGQWIQAADGRWWYRHSDGTYTAMVGSILTEAGIISMRMVGCRRDGYYWNHGIIYKQTELW